MVDYTMTFGGKKVKLLKWRIRLSSAFIWPYTFIPQDLECGALELTNVKRIYLPLQMWESRNVKGV